VGKFSQLGELVIEFPFRAADASFKFVPHHHLVLERVMLLHMLYCLYSGKLTDLKTLKLSSLISGAIPTEMYGLLVAGRHPVSF
jgi:hypothetical protein